MLANINPTSVQRIVFTQRPEMIVTAIIKSCPDVCLDQQFHR